MLTFKEDGKRDCRKIIKRNRNKYLTSCERILGDNHFTRNFAKQIRDFLIFAGGTALRLTYGSPRFSDDMDFYLRKKLSFSLFKSVMENIKKRYSLEITDLYNKYFTFLAEFKIKENYPVLPFRIKIEVGKKLLKRLSTPSFKLANDYFQILLYFLNLKKIGQFKKKALRGRKNRGIFLICGSFPKN